MRSRPPEVTGREDSGEGVMIGREGGGRGGGGGGGEVGGGGGGGGIAPVGGNGGGGGGGGGCMEIANDAGISIHNGLGGLQEGVMTYDDKAAAVSAPSLLISDGRLWSGQSGWSALGEFSFLLL